MAVCPSEDGSGRRFTLPDVRTQVAAMIDDVKASATFHTEDVGTRCRHILDKAKFDARRIEMEEKQEVAVIMSEGRQRSEGLWRAWKVEELKIMREALKMAQESLSHRRIAITAVSERFNLEKVRSQANSLVTGCSGSESSRNCEEAVRRANLSQERMDQQTSANYPSSFPSTSDYRDLLETRALNMSPMSARMSSSVVLSGGSSSVQQLSGDTRDTRDTKDSYCDRTVRRVRFDLPVTSVNKRRGRVSQRGQNKRKGGDGGGQTERGGPRAAAVAAGKRIGQMHSKK